MAVYRMLALVTTVAAIAACQVDPDTDPNSDPMPGDPPTAEAPDAEEPPDTATADPDSIRDRFIRSGLIEIGETREEIQSTLGEPDSTTRRAVENRHDPSRTDTIIRLHYDGLTARIHRPADLDDLLDQVTVRDDRYLQQDAIRIGMPWSEVRSRLGEPEGERDGGYLYACGTCGPVSEPIVVVVDDGVVSSIRFDYYVD